MLPFVFRAFSSPRSFYCFFVQCIILTNLLTKQQLGEAIEVALPDPKVVSAVGSDVVYMWHLFLVEHGMHALADSEQPVLVAAGDV